MIINFYLSGIGTAAFAIAGLFFLKFWLVSRDRFFAFLCASCWLLSFGRMMGLIMYLHFSQNELAVNHTRPWVYLIRLAAFVLILLAVIEKNRRVHFDK